MRLVVDANVAVKWLIAEEGSDAADRLLANGDDLYAPCLMASEIANALWRKVRLGEVDRGQAGVLMAAVSEMPVRWGADETLCADAVRLALAARLASLRLHVLSAGASPGRPVGDGGLALRECAGVDRARRYGNDAGGSCAGRKLTRPSSRIRVSAASVPAQSTICMSMRVRRWIGGFSALVPT